VNILIRTLTFTALSAHYVRPHSRYVLSGFHGSFLFNTSLATTSAYYKNSAKTATNSCTTLEKGPKYWHHQLRNKPQLEPEVETSAPSLLRDPGVTLGIIFSPTQHPCFQLQHAKKSLLALHWYKSPTGNLVPCCLLLEACGDVVVW
jgi:hypothetical protein